MKNLQLYKALKSSKLTPSTIRIFTEIDYALQLNKFGGGIFSDEIDNVIKYLCGLKSIEFEDILRCEEMMKNVAAAAKKQQCICVAHAHMDVNWMWGYDETVALTLSTIETMLKLLEKYDKFTYSQSTAFVFETVEKYRPDLLEKIKKYIAEGRFEITGSTYVEADKNLSDANTMLKHFEFSKNYLSALFGLPDEYFNMDFEPDTFGHTLFEPEILAESGIKYLYHCRGNNMPPIYRWHAPSGKSVLVYREPFWYNAEIGYGDFEFIPDFCSRYGTDKTLKVYGVGDHGGGATMRDVDRIMEISEYPVMADIKFGTYREFFAHLETLKNIPEAHGEQNDIFTGCYSSASEIKAENEICQNALFEQELFCSADDFRYDNSEGIKCILLNQFHDVITGSGTSETAHYAMAGYQRAKAQLGALKARALRNFENAVNTATLFKQSEYISETAAGAGVGFGAKRLNYTDNLAYGKERAYVVFNQLNFKRRRVVTLPVWDYCGNVNLLKAYDCEDKPLPLTVKNADNTFYWSHNFSEVDVCLELGANEYATIILREEQPDEIKQIGYPPLFQRTEKDYGDIVLENIYLKAVFDRMTFKLISLYDKKNKLERLSDAAGFKLLTEDITEQMTAWYVGRIKNSEDIQRNVKFISETRDENIQSFAYEISFGSSALKVMVSLESCANGLTFDCDCNFYEKGSPVDGIPNLTFELPVGNFDKVLCDTSPGLITRKAKEKDVACASFISANGVQLLSCGKHGFRGFESLRLCLLRASCDPNPLPEYGAHKFSFGVFLSPEKNTDYLRQSLDFRTPLVAVSATPHTGEKALKGKFADIPENAICISAGSNWLTLFNPENADTEVEVYGNKYTLGGQSLKRFSK